MLRRCSVGAPQAPRRFPAGSPQVPRRFPGTGVADLETSIPAIIIYTFPPVGIFARACGRALQGSSHKAPCPGWIFFYGRLYMDISADIMPLSCRYQCRYHADIMPISCRYQCRYHADIMLISCRYQCRYQCKYHAKIMPISCRYQCPYHADISADIMPISCRYHADISTDTMPISC